MTGIDPAQLKWRVVAPTLAALGLGGDAAVNLLTGTALVESGGVWLAQLGGGPALGLWQMEPATHDDIWRTFLPDDRFAEIETRVRRMTCSDLPRVQQLVGNLRYACAMARLKYYRAPDALPAANDAAGLSVMHKRVYNTMRGAADPTTNIAAFAAAINA
ncbi:hypothetical protein AA13595_1303 [Gluconacetobacter johannae DSM 13595]|uniref:Uncharacterized protein n=2 Tax=Gluconacetobacter johannae TaxID=112140 RepID=A0A7W4P4C8_9PROT|nr:hypothetical protein [Gluconacetobacter johannae]MBB2176789.1 hypothetical protein [Gluconacetobacter johannae]GBQ84022.1 hypothetical protein AA13595_1303 [Gluconacetobacter johannae DSM 13595]